MHPLPPLPIFKASSLASILKLPDYYNLQTGVYYRNPSSVDSFSKLHHSREESAEKVKYSQGLHWRRRRMMKKVVICQAALTPTGVVDNNGKTTPNSGHPFVQVEGVSYRPPGTQLNLLNNVSLSLPDKSLGLIYGRSGSGKTTLLQVLAGLATPTEGSIRIGRASSERSLASQAGIVFQFPERYFLADTVLEELTFGWSRRAEDMLLRQQLAMRLQAAVFAVGMADIPFDKNPRTLSDGYKRRLALAVQLVRMPDLLLLDEPLAGLDWKARADVVNLLWSLKGERTLIVRIGTLGGPGMANGDGWASV
ncbi:hypothetical protein CY35_11G103900 [Sphagnum magellanicum]|nr:hypothetical protein CY35_11G103900 [Sphagnum magellanicum]